MIIVVLYYFEFRMDFFAEKEKSTVSLNFEVALNKNAQMNSQFRYIGNSTSRLVKGLNIPTFPLKLVIDHGAKTKYVLQVLTRIS